MRYLRHLVVAATGWIVLGLGATSATAAPLPLALAHLANARQVLVVQTGGLNDDHGTLQGWEKGRAGRWLREISTQPADVGLDGLIAGNRRRTNDLRTPEGSFALTEAFGILANPGSGLPYTRLSASDYWAGDPRDPSTYNLFEPVHPASARWSTADAEHLIGEWPDYRYAVNIDWNAPGDVHTARDGERLAGRPANTREGYAIFLHTFGATGPDGYTLGCVAISPGGLVHVLRWLNPALHPRIVIGTTSDIARQ